MAFGIYIHIPFCRQICSYCDFTKYELGKNIAPEQYVELVLSEIRQRAPTILSYLPSPDVDSIYFGGGTPSLLEPKSILAILQELATQGLCNTTEAELTIEIDPATVDAAKLDTYLEMGLNRFSVGAQSFDDRFLKLAGRKHSAKDVGELLRLLKERNLNFSFDLLFALPKQTLSDLQLDLDRVAEFRPSHLSAYCLTVPEKHKLSLHRPTDDQQFAMFELIEHRLSAVGLKRYEISNFACEGFESRHNLLYWSDQPYWGIGLSSHSYLPSLGPWGARFWNVKAMREYQAQYQLQKCEPPSAPLGGDFFAQLAPAQIEYLKRHESLTDFCHTSLRVFRGLDANALHLKFGEKTAVQVEARLASLVDSGHVQPTTRGWQLTGKGIVVANLVFEKLTFLRSDFFGDLAN